MATDLMATSTTALILFHSILLTCSLHSCFVENAPRFARRSGCLLDTAIVTEPLKSNAVLWKTLEELDLSRNPFEEGAANNIGGFLRKSEKVSERSERALMKTSQQAKRAASEAKRSEQQAKRSEQQAKRSEQQANSKRTASERQANGKRTASEQQANSKRTASEQQAKRTASEANSKRTESKAS